MFCEALSRARLPLSTKLQQFLDNPAFILEQKYKHLEAKADPTPRIPRIIHHIWLTNSIQKREIPEEDIQNVLETEKFFSQSGQKWEHIVWTNDKNLIPASVKKLELNGIQVRETSELEAHLKLNKQVGQLIKQSLWGMASDTLRYDLVYYLGGVYADLGFKFTRDVEAEIHKYDFFNTALGLIDMENYFFGSKAGHPILRETLSSVETNLEGLTEPMVALAKKVLRITNTITYAPFTDAYYTAANNGTVDVMYPGHYKKAGCKTLQQSIGIMEKYIGQNQILDFLRSGANFYIYLEENDKPEIKELSYGRDILKFSWLEEAKEAP